MMFKHKNKSKKDEEREYRYCSNKSLSKSLDENILLIKGIFNEDDTIIYRYFENQHNNDVKCCIVFVNGMVNAEIINENIIKPVAVNTTLKNSSNVLEIICKRVILSNIVKNSAEIDELIDTLMNGNTVFLIEGVSEFLSINSQGLQNRAIEEPQTEKVLRGPREGFTESLMINLSLVRKKLKTADLKFRFRVIGDRSNTKVCICYIDGVANKKILHELNDRLNKIDIDGILDSGYIEEIIKDAPFSPFKTIGSTERPDVIAGKLLEGRIAILIDGSPTALTAPFIFIENFQANDDYYINFYFSSIGRILRIFGFIINISTPALYIAIVTFHQEMIPTPLLLNISASREGIPFPTTVEALAMLLIFEILRETGLRMPTYIGQALSIVGALVIGQAAVDARFISAPMVIIVAFTGITSLLIPKLSGAGILLRLLLVLLASIVGVYGYLIGIAGLLAYLFEIRSFGVPYLYKLMVLNPMEDLKDTIIRVPWWYLKFRPKLIALNRLRNNSGR